MKLAAENKNKGKRSVLDQQRQGKTTNQMSEFLAWWSYELSLLCPLWLTEKLKPRQKKLAILVDEKGYSLFEGNQPVTNTATIVELLTILKNYKKHSIGISIPKEQYFKRTLDLPAEARFRLNDILSIDMERSTPFKRDKVYTDYVVEETGDKRLHVTQLIAKRTFIDTPRDVLEQNGVSVHYASVIDPDHQQIDFLKSNRTRDPLSFSTALYTIVVLLLALIAFFTIDRQEQALKHLQGEIESRQNTARIIQSSIQRKHKEFSGILSLQQRKLDTVSRLLIWNEIAKKLPDTAWITELKINQNTATISGYAKTAETLLKILDQSPHFTDVNFIAPVSRDNQKKQERFSLRFTIKEQKQ